MVIGWTGSQSTLRYLEVIRDALCSLRRRREFEFRVICDVDPGFPDLPGYRFVPWRIGTEIQDLDELDIGLMPVPKEDWANGKVGFKAIQYSAIGIVPVVSDVGSGGDVVEHCLTGLIFPNVLYASPAALERLLAVPLSIPAMARSGFTAIPLTATKELCRAIHRMSRTRNHEASFNFPKIPGFTLLVVEACSATPFTELPRLPR